ncbi:MAG: dihydroneopterin aldolase family protein [Nitrososphaerota archaeon]|nr:dihydroneopterin aldolase family protein [Candidatus Geocrenenecus dongiae]
MEKHLPEALKYFSKLTDRDHALFELGISLGAIFHQLVGMPIPLESLESLEEAFSKAFSRQPFREIVEIKIIKEKLIVGSSPPYDYGVITPSSLDVRVVVKYGGVKVSGRLRWVEELGYPLMYVEEVVEG